MPVVCGSLREALGELRNDHAFLLKGDVFNMDQIEAYMELKWKEVYAFEHTPPPDRIPDVLFGLTAPSPTLKTRPIRARRCFSDLAALDMAGAPGADPPRSRAGPQLKAARDA